MSCSRRWINQPSTSQPFHHLHGKRVIAEDKTYGNYSFVYPISGDKVVIHIPTICLSFSQGWPESSKP